MHENGLEEDTCRVDLFLEIEKLGFVFFCLFFFDFCFGRATS